MKISEELIKDMVTGYDAKYGAFWFPERETWQVCTIAEQRLRNIAALLGQRPVLNNMLMGYFDQAVEAVNFCRKMDETRKERGAK